MLAHVTGNILVNPVRPGNTQASFNKVVIGSGNGLSADERQAIIWTEMIMSIGY